VGLVVTIFSGSLSVPGTYGCLKRLELHILNCRAPTASKLTSRFSNFDFVCTKYGAYLSVCTYPSSCFHACCSPSPHEVMGIQCGHSNYIDYLSIHLLQTGTCILLPMDGWDGFVQAAFRDGMMRCGYVSGFRYPSKKKATPEVHITNLHCNIDVRNRGVSSEPPRHELFL